MQKIEMQLLLNTVLRTYSPPRKILNMSMERVLRTSNRISRVMVQSSHSYKSTTDNYLIVANNSFEGKFVGAMLMLYIHFFQSLLHILPLTKSIHEMSIAKQ